MRRKVKDRTGIAMAHVADWQQYSDTSIDAKGREHRRTGYRPIVCFGCYERERHPEQAALNDLELLVAS